MKHFLTLALTCLPLLCFGAPSISYTSYFNNTHTYTNATVAGSVSAASGVVTNALTAGTVTSTKAFRSYQSSLTWASTLNLDFDATTTVVATTLGGNTTFTTSNLQTNRTYRLKITGAATNCTPTFPAWNFLGGAPTTITANKVGMLSLEAWGATDASVVAAYAESQ